MYKVKKALNTCIRCCEVCYACLHNCPQHAIHMPMEAGTAQFRNEHVSLQDMIAANE